MENIWTKINERVPQYFEFMSQKYTCNFVKISALKNSHCRK